MKKNMYLAFFAFSFFANAQDLKPSSVAKIPVGDEKINFTVNGVAAGNNSYTLSIAKQELMFGAYKYPLIENITLDDQLNIKNNAFYDVLTKGMDGIVDFEPGVIINEKRKTDQSIPEVIWSVFGKKTSLSYRQQSLAYDPFTNTYYGYEPKIDDSKKVTFPELKEESFAKELSDFPTVTETSGLKSQFYQPNLSSYAIAETSGKVCFTGGVMLKGKDVDKYNYLRNQYITTFDLTGKKTNQVELKFDYPRKLYHANKLNNGTGGAIFLYGRATGIGKKNNDPNKANFWAVLVDEDGNETFKHKLKVSGGIGIFKPIASFSRDDKVIVLSQNGGLVWDVMSIDKIGLAKNVNNETKNIPQSGIDGDEFRYHDKVVVNTLVTKTGEALVYGYYRKELQKAGVDPATKKAMEQIVEYPAVFAYQIGKDLKIKASYNQKIANKKNELPIVDMMDMGNGKVAWMTRYTTSGNSSSARTQLQAFALKDQDLTANKSQNYTLGIINVTDQSAIFKSGRSSNYELSNKMPYFFNPNGELLVIGNTKSPVSGVHQVIVEKFK